MGWIAVRLLTFSRKGQHLKFLWVTLRYVSDATLDLLFLSFVFRMLGFALVGSGGILFLLLLDLMEWDVVLAWLVYLPYLGHSTILSERGLG